MEIANKISISQTNISYAMLDFLNDDITKYKDLINYHAVRFIAKNLKAFNLSSQTYHSIMRYVDCLKYKVYRVFVFSSRLFHKDSYTDFAMKFSIGIKLTKESIRHR